MLDGRMLGRTLTGKAESDAPDLVETLLGAAHAKEPKRRVLAIAGPARSGKSRVLAEFVRRCGQDAFNLSLTEDDTTLFAFVFALVQSMGPIARGAQLSFSAMQSRLSAPNAIPQIASWLDSHINAAAWIAVDNVELLERDSPVVHLLVAIVERSSRLRWLFSGRSIDALPIEAWMEEGIAHAAFSTQTVESVSLPDAIAALDETESQLLAALAPLRTLEPRVVDAILGESGTLSVRRLYERMPSMFDLNGSVRLHRDVRLAVLQFVGSRSDDMLQSAVARCGEALEAFEQYEELLQMYLRNRAHAQLDDVMSRRGLALADHVNADTLDAALHVVSGDSPGARSLRAILASRRGQYDVAEALFESAAREASQPLAAQILYAYGCDLLRRNHGDSAPIFERLLSENVPGAAHQSEIRSALAQAYVLSDRPAAALEQIKFALHVLRSDADESVVKTRAAYVYFYAARDLALAERIASDALAQALHARAYTVAVGAASLLYNIACERDRPKEAIAALNLLADCGIKLGNVAFQSYAIIAMLEYHVEAGDLAKIARAMETLRAFDISSESLAASESLVVADAMQRSWRGDFTGAYKVLEPTASQAVGEDYLALREAQLAFFAAGSGRVKAAQNHARRASEALRTLDPSTHKATRARIFLGTTLSAIGDVAAAEEQFECGGEAAPQFPRLAVVREGAVALHHLMHGGIDCARLNDAFARMRERGAGGFAMMFDEFPRPRPRPEEAGSTTIEQVTARRPACS